MDNMINPIVIDKDKNVCPFCGGKIVLLQHESSLIDIDKDGIPVESETLKFEIKGICKNCYKEIGIDKDGIYFSEHSAYLNIKKQLKLEKANSNPFFINPSCN